MNFIKPITIFLILVLVACATSEVYFDKDESVNISAYRTFAWFPTPTEDFKNGSFNTQILEHNIKREASDILKQKGYEANSDSPDIVLEYHISVEKKEMSEQQPVYSSPYNYRYPGNYDPNWRGGGNINAYNNAPYVIGYKTVEIPYEEGTLTISAIDRKSNTLIWRGWSVGTIKDEVDYGLAIRKDIPEIFKNFPDQQEKQEAGKKYVP